MYRVCESVIRYAAPRAISSIPSVTMNEGIDQATQTAPLRTPHRAPTARASTADAQIGQPQPAMAIPSTAPESQHRPDREVDPPGDDDQRHAGGDDHQVGDLVDDALERPPRQKFRLNRPNSTISPASTSSRPTRSARPAGGGGAGAICPFPGLTRATAFVRRGVHHGVPWCRMIGCGYLDLSDSAVISSTGVVLSAGGLALDQLEGELDAEDRELVGVLVGRRQDRRPP